MKEGSKRLVGTAVSIRSLKSLIFRRINQNPLPQSVRARVLRLRFLRAIRARIKKDSLRDFDDTQTNTHTPTLTLLIAKATCIDDVLNSSQLNFYLLNKFIRHKRQAEKQIVDHTCICAPHTHPFPPKPQIFFTPRRYLVAANYVLVVKPNYLPKRRH